MDSKSFGHDGKQMCEMVVTLTTLYTHDRCMQEQAS